MQWPLALALLHSKSMRKAHAFMNCAPQLGNEAMPQRCACWLPLVTLLPRWGHSLLLPHHLLLLAQARALPPWSASLCLISI